MQYKKPGYILLLTMIIISSLFLMVMTIVKKTQISYGTLQSMNFKHEQSTYLINAITILKELMIMKEDTKDKKNENKNHEIDFFTFYWKYGNKWTVYSLENKKYNINVKISLYITIDDGKFPLKLIFKEYNEENNKNKLNDYDNNNDNNDNLIENKNNTKNNDNKKNILNNDQKNNENIDLTKNKFLKEIKLIFEKIESSQKNNIGKLIINQNKNENKKSFIWNAIEQYTKNNKGNPLSLEDIFFDSDHKENNFPYDDYVYNLKANTNKKESKAGALFDLLSLENNQISPLFISPCLIEIFGQKEITLNTDTREKIIADGKKFLEKNQSKINVGDFWKEVLEKNIEVSYPKEILENSEIKKIMQENTNYPQNISTIIKIEMLNKILFALVTFEKNKRYDKDNKECSNQNREYLIKSIYILPIT